ncbi:MAG: Fur family transcriptional regulator [Peptococcaceae bacterium]|jgi:Mn-dependent DtxR family transcriptional regulator|nr:Fur family transcriptional regulator [Peptococcaceae bacterium]
MPKMEFHTFRDYMTKSGDLLTASMEDYLEMIYRISLNSAYIRTNDLASALNVQPPSITKMMKKLANIGLVNYEKYGIITLTQKGQGIGKALLDRHLLVEGFLTLLGVAGDILEETEKVEHTISDHTLACIDSFMAFVGNRPDIISDWTDFRRKIRPTPT